MTLAFNKEAIASTESIRQFLIPVEAGNFRDIAILDKNLITFHHFGVPVANTVSPKEIRDYGHRTLPSYSQGNFRPVHVAPI